MRSTLLTMLILAAGAAEATPPRAVFVDETILGETADHLMVLQRFRDNLGFHYTMQTDVILVARPLRGGGSESWPVSAVVDYGPSWEEFGMPQRLADRTPAGAVDPFAMLRERGGFNLLVGPDKGEFAEAAVTEKAVVVRQGGKITHSLPLSDAGDALAGALAGTRGLLSERQARPVDVVDVPVSAVACRTEGHHSFPLQLEPYEPGFAVKLSCTDDVETAGAAVWLVVPPVED